MSDFLSTLLDRALGQAPVLQRRRPSLFETPAGPQPVAPDIAWSEEIQQKHSLRTAPALPESPLKSAHEARAFTETRAPSPVASQREAPAPVFAPTLNPPPPAPFSAGPPPILERTPAPAAVIIERTREIETIVEREVQKPVLPSPADASSPQKHFSPVQRAESPRPASPLSVPAAVRTEARTLPAPTLVQSTIKPQAPLPRPTVVTRPLAPRAESQRGQVRSPEPPPPIHVSIGRIEVRAAQPAATAARKPHIFAPKLSLDDYLASRNGGSK